MKNVKYRCRKCGYILEIPERTESVLCGSCATWNRPRGLIAVLNSEPGEEPSEGSILQKVPGSIFSEIPGPSSGGQAGKPVPEEENEAAPKPGIFTLAALLFFLAPFVSFIVSKFNLPPLITFIVLAAVFTLYMIGKKRS